MKFSLWIRLQKKYLKPKFVSLVISLLASVFLFLSGYLTYQSMQKNIENSLTLQALGIEVVLRSLLQNFDLDLLNKQKDFLSNLILNERWEGVAFIALYLENGTIILHSNPNLIGKNVEESPLLLYRKNTSYFKLKTGERVFLYEQYVPSQNFKGILRIALHIGPIAESLSYARLHITLELIFACFLLFGSILASITIHKMEKKLEKMTELEKWQFITKILLHEIKNPLATIKGFTQYLRRKLDLNGGHAQALDLMLKETLRIEKLLQELSLYSFPLSPELEEVDLDKLLDEIALSMKIIYPEGKLILHTEKKNIKMMSDPRMLKSILLNLLDNAFYATIEAGEREVFLTLREENRHICLEIKDKGRGIEEKNLPHIFEPFYTTKPRGSGLGLAVVKKLCEALNIEISLHSTPKVGTLVRLKFPQQKG